MTDPQEITSRGARALGMDRPISRRDLFDGVAAAAGMAALGSLPGTGGPRAATGGASVPGLLPEFHRPPALTGLRGGTPESLGVPHALRDNRFWAHAGTPEPTGERYDLVVVGCGISGVSAAYRWRREDPGARILILDNHDDFGGHARRSEFHPGGSAGPLVGYGGSRSIDAPSTWTAEGRDLLDRLGVRIERLARCLDRDLYASLGMHDSVLCDRESFGTDRLVRLPPGVEAARWIAGTPLAGRARQDLLMLTGDPPDWFPGLSDGEKKERLSRLTYAGFLRDVCRVHPDVLRFVQTLPNDEWGYGSDAFGAIDAWGCADERRYPGFQGMGLDRSRPSEYNTPRVIRRWGADDSGARHFFPEGNQALVRMMIARMIPGLTRAAGMEDVTTARFDYGGLDLPGNRVRVRLSSPVVSVANDGDPGTATTATVGYFDGERVRTVRAAGVIMACWNMMVPYLVEGLAPEQSRALRAAVKVPVVYAAVQLRDWRAWREVGVSRTRFTGAYWCTAELGPAVDIGGYRCPREVGRPIIAHLAHTPAVPGMSPAEGSVAGRRRLLQTPYAHLEYGIRDQLTRLLGPGGFDAARDVEAITINRWGHGYAPEYATPWDLGFYPRGTSPASVARRRFGRIAIANADSVPAASADAAISAAYRAVLELRAPGR
ncbi:spermidine dehydrogenase SpdH [Streptosporangium violaceochromogenes]|nr:spermidine dehydrogenase SpdH [Streptosporangium violaceochromogenes]